MGTHVIGNGQLASRITQWLGRPLKATGIQDISELSIAVGTTIGDVRTENQDRAVVARYTGEDAANQWIALVVCDGLGGMVDGAQCAEIATSVFLASLAAENNAPLITRVLTALRNANHSIYRRYRERGGTTIVGVVFSGKGVAFSVGDSRIYEFEPPTTLKQLSVDDSLAGELHRLNIATAVDAEISSKITQYVGIGESFQPHIYELDFRVDSNKSLILTSDGIHGPIGPLLVQLLQAAPNLNAAVTRLVHFSRWCGGFDNATLIAASGRSFTIQSSSKERSSTLEIWDSFSKIEIYLGAPRTSQLNDETHIVKTVEPPPLPLPSQGATKNAKRKSRKTTRQQGKVPKQRSAKNQALNQRQLDISIVDAGSTGADRPDNHRKQEDTSPNVRDQSERPHGNMSTRQGSGEEEF